MHGSFDHGEVGSVYEHDAATVINAAWRGHLSRSYVNGMRAKKAKTTSSVKRTFSFSSKKKRDKPAHQPPATPVAPAVEEDPFANMHANNAAQSGKKASLGSRVRRSLSFDRKSSSTSSSSVQSTSATKRTFVVERGPNGLGLELDATNTVVTVKPGGRAERQGLLALGDTILSIDGKSCAGVLMQECVRSPAHGLRFWPPPMACAFGPRPWPPPMPPAYGLRLWPTPLACTFGLRLWPLPSPGFPSAVAVGCATYCRSENGSELPPLSFPFAFASCVSQRHGSRPFSVCDGGQPSGACGLCPAAQGWHRPPLALF